MPETGTQHNRRRQDEAICPSAGMRRVYDFVARVAPTDLDVLITGERGVGKELVARHIHRLSRRSNKPFVKIAPAQLESSLFAGGLLGTRPFVAWSSWSGRDGATLYFDEIAELSEPTQTALLQMILDRDSRRTDAAGSDRPEVRILAASCRDLWKDVLAGKFREDLFLRLHAVEIVVPPLRERPDDVPVLIEAFVEQFETELSRPFSVEFQPAQFDALAACEWPANVRELREFVRQIVANGTDPSVAVETRVREFGRRNGRARGSALSLGEAARLTSEAVERRLILKALEESGGDRKLASRRLNISYRALVGKIRNLQIAV